MNSHSGWPPRHVRTKPQPSTATGVVDTTGGKDLSFHQLGVSQYQAPLEGAAARPPVHYAQLALKPAERAPEAVVGGHQAAPRLGKLQRLLRIPPGITADGEVRPSKTLLLPMHAPPAAFVGATQTLHGANLPLRMLAPPHLFFRMSHEMQSVAERDTPAPQCTSTPAKSKARRQTRWGDGDVERLSTGTSHAGASNGASEVS